MDAPETSKPLNEERYSRQLYVLDLQAMKRIRRAKVLLSGLRGLGAEVAKNLVLMGVGSLTLHDSQPACWSDLAAQFFLSEKDLGRSRAEASREAVAELSEDTQVCVHQGDLTEDLLLREGFQVVVLTASRLEEQLKVGRFCHKHGIYFLVADTWGLVGQLFCDFGDHFTVQDPTETEPSSAVVHHISQGSPGILTLRADTHDFRDGDLVTFSGVEGMVELNGCDPRTVRIRKDRTLEIGNTTAFSCYLRGGLVTEVKKPETVSHKPLDAALLQPRMVAHPQDVGRALCLHQAVRALHEFQHQKGRLPQPWDPSDAEVVVNLAQTLEPLKGTKGESLAEPLDEGLVRMVALSSAGSLSPLAAILGALAAQEVLKRGCRYDGQIAVFGAGLQEELGHKHYLLVGAGAIGCELLKGFALMGLGAGGRGGVTVADMDLVEHSNLSRQFLFRPQDIHRNKAEAAAEATHRLNPDLKVTPSTQPLGPTTERTYGDDFFSSVDGVAAALDSFEARHYVAARCAYYLKPLLQAGTQGMLGSASVFVPEVTAGYEGPSSDAPEDAPYPACTIRHFPSRVEHTLQWARNEFEGLFCLSAKTINHIQQTLTSPVDVAGARAPSLQQVVLGELSERPQTWRDCVVWAYGHWQLCFHHGVKQLLRHFPPDKVLEDGTPFWSGARWCPRPLDFDVSQDSHVLYVLAAANLYAQMHGLCGSQDQDALRGLLESPLRPAPQRQASGPESSKKLNEALKIWSKGPPLKPQTFEKDNDSNFHMDFVVAAANLKAQNYGIPPANHAQSKRILGLIIPAIATTTAAVAGLVSLELYKLEGMTRSLDAFRHSYLRLAENQLNRWKPDAPATHTFQTLQWTCWTRLKVTAGQPEMTLKSLLTYVQEQHKLTVNLLLSGSALLYSTQLPAEEQAQCQALRVTELVQQVTGQVLDPEQRVLVLELGCEGDEEDTNFPPLHYVL
ncbi:ubiquitin-like modifier-activating enzyme 7 isoform X2 [Erinaceus europaeus]|uniref:Ubiquitin-like modifier-activating enzyme 7 isoform X2 n=1 Tax=Erinaceus europaeus TaxID=9365 RepID=A0ABM3YHT7_ERIEU|nr:ubiquitin-like modifier-activating enzyme 7 isoform X2 [Erinaceus europaeus]